jgi:predicted transcriptional regulator|tara:strand:- start:42 stop:221 length:180 start_codon:yes stop_codon:yes gene_type:complete
MATHVTIGVNKETHKKLGKLASLTHRTRANTVEWLVEKAIKEIEIAEKNGSADHIKFGI